MAIAEDGSAEPTSKCGIADLQSETVVGVDGVGVGGWLDVNRAISTDSK
jgi:hypothetical protein